jgi:hypothetical protein
VKVVLKHRSLPPGRPGPTPMGSFAQSAFVDEDDRSSLAEGVFFTSGQRTFFQWAMAFSSRSRARPVGRWQLQPIFRRIFHTWPGWYRTPVSSSMSEATRSVVQSSVSYPNAPGPRFNARSMRFNSMGPSRGFRPARPGCLRAALPPSANALAHRFTDCRWAPTRRATSASDTPCASSFAALSRRRSSAWKSRFIPAGCPMPTNIHCMGQNVTILCENQ